MRLYTPGLLAGLLGDRERIAVGEGGGGELRVRCMELKQPGVSIISSPDQSQSSTTVATRYIDRQAGFNAWDLLGTKPHGSKFPDSDHAGKFAD